MPEEDKKRYINILFDEQSLQAIDDFRFKNRIPTRTEAIRKLIERALKMEKPNVK